MERVGLDHHTLEIQLAKQLPQNRPLMVFAGGVAGLADRHTQSGRIQRDLGNERRPATCGGLNGAPKSLAVTDQLVEITRPTWDLGDGPVADRSTESRHIHVLEEVAEGRIGRRSPELKAQSHCEHAVVADRKALQIPQALAAAQDPEHRNQQQVPGRDANAPSHAHVRDRLEIADQIEIGCSRNALEHREEAIPPTSTHADSCGKRPWDRL